MLNQPTVNSELKISSKAKRYSDEDRAHHLEAWKKSGMSMSEYCKDKDITVSTLSKWKQCTNQAKTQFKPVTLSSAAFYNQNGTIEIFIDNRIKIRLPTTTNVSMIINIVRSLI